MKTDGKQCSDSEHYTGTTDGILSVISKKRVKSKKKNVYKLMTVDRQSVNSEHMVTRRRTGDRTVYI